MLDAGLVDGYYGNDDKGDKDDNEYKGDKDDNGNAHVNIFWYVLLYCNFFN